MGRANILKVYYRTREVGELWIDADAIFRFRYTPSWCRNGFSIGRVLPLSQIESQGREVEYFFSNFLPEGARREVIERELRTDGSDFALLRELGREIAGALSLAEPGIKPPDAEGSYSPILSLSALGERLRALPFRPILHGSERSSLSLAGAQHKMTVLRTKEGIRIPQNGAASDCILKISSPDFPDLVFNEYICMKLAAHVGLPCAAVSLLRVENQWVLAVDRYDRFTRTGRVERLHQQDFCQLLGIPHSLKYEFYGGPGLSQCVSAMREVSALPIVDANLMAQWYTFNLLIGNMDAHAKNISVIYKKDTGWRLAPFYDIIHTIEYEDLRDVPAMLPDGKEVRLHEITPAMWSATMKGAGLSPKSCLAFAHRTADSLSAAVHRFPIPPSILHGKHEADFRRILRSIDSCVSSANFLP